MKEMHFLRKKRLLHVHTCNKTTKVVLKRKRGHYVTKERKRGYYITKECLLHNERERALCNEKEAII